MSASHGAGAAAVSGTGAVGAAAPGGAPTLPVGTSPVFGGPAPSVGPTAAAQDPGAPVGLGGSTEFARAHDDLRPLGHEEYHALVRERMADLERLDPGASRLVPDGRMLVALDVDGTILDMDGHVSERVMASIARLRAHGVPVVIATGRGIQAALPVARHVGLTDGWMVCANGALTLRMDPDAAGGYDAVDSVTFDPASAIDILRRAVPEAIVAVEDLGTGFRASRAFPEGELIEEQTIVSIEDLRSRPVTRVILRAPGMDLEEFSALVAGAGLNSVEYAIGWTAWLDVAPEGVTKASALEALTGRLGIDRASTLTVGDGTNDLEMLRWAGVGAVMGSAPHSVKDEGDLVTAAVWHDGCAAVLDAVVERTRGTR